MAARLVPVASARPAVLAALGALAVGLACLLADEAWHAARGRQPFDPRGRSWPAIQEGAATPSQFGHAILRAGFLLAALAAGLVLGGTPP